jgi:hypothetical protein
LKVSIEYYDNDSLTSEEVVLQAQRNYGKNAVVEVRPDSTAPHDAIYFALQQIITYKQLSLLFDRQETYQLDISQLRAETLKDVAEILDTVIIENEAKIT